jgi:hypothetical protein
MSIDVVRGNHAPALNNSGIDQDKTVTTATATGSLLQKPVTLEAANLGSCDKNPGKADTILDTGAIVGSEGGNIESWVDLRGAGSKIDRGVDKVGIRPPQEKIKILKKSAQQGEFISDKIIDALTPTSAMDGNSGGCKGSEGMRNKDKCGAAGMQHLNILPTKCKSFHLDMGISTASAVLSNEVGELAKKYQSWHKLMADKNQSAGRPASQITTGCARIYLVKMRNKIRDSLEAEKWAS